MRFRLPVRAAPAVAVLAAAGLRSPGLEMMSLWSDEGLTFYRAAQPLAAILGGEIPLDALITRDVQPPLYFVLLAGWFNGLPFTPWSGRAMSMLASLPTVALVWALGSRLSGRRAAAWAAALAALSPVYLWYAQEARNYSLAITLAAAASYAMWRALSAAGLMKAPGPRARLTTDRPHPAGATEQAGGATAPRSPFAPLGASKPTAAWTAIAVAADAALAWTHYLGLFVIAFHALFALSAVLAAPSRRALRDRTGVAIRRLLVPLAVIFLVAAPLMPFAVRRLGTGAEKDQRFYPLWVMLRDIFRDFALGRAVDHSGLGWRLAWVWWLLAAVAVFGAWRLARRRPWSAALAIGWLLIPTAAFFAVTLIQPRYQGVRHILLQSPPYYLLLGTGIAALVGRAGRTGRPRGADIAGIAAGVLAAGSMIWACTMYFTRPEYHKDDLRGLARHVEARAVPGDALLVSDPVLRHVFEVHDPGVPVVSMPPLLADGRPDPRGPGELLGPLLRKHGRLWFMSPHDDAQAWLARNALAVERRAFHGLGIPVRLTAWEKAPEADAWPPQTRPLKLGGLELAGWSIAPERPAAGRGARVHLAWLVAERERPDYKVVIRALDGSGTDWANGDHEPFHGLRPTSTWPFGEVVVEPHDVLVRPGTPPGSYALAIQVYAEGGDPIPADGAYPIGQIVVDRAGARARLSPSEVDGRLGGVASGVSLAGWSAGLRAGGTEREAGTRLPLVVWLSVRDAGLARGVAALRAEVIDRAGRTARRAQAGLDWAGAAVGDLRAVPLPIDLPPDGGRYALRLQLLGADGSDLALLGGAPPYVRRWAWLDGLTVKAPARRMAAPDVARVLDAHFDSVATLIGADLPTSPLVPGAALPVTLWWRAANAPLPSYHVTLQLVPVDVGDQPAGPPVSQHDGPPGGGARPTAGWATGEVVEDARRLAVPADLPSGRYALIAALYNPAAPSLPRPRVEQEPYDEPRDHAVVRLFTVGERVPGAADDPAGAPAR